MTTHIRTEYFRISYRNLGVTVFDWVYKSQLQRSGLGEELVLAFRRARTAAEFIIKSSLLLL